MFVAFALLLAHPHETVTPVDLGGLSVREARKLGGRTVLVTLVAETPPFTLGGNAITGYRPDRDGTRRGVVVAGSAESHDLRIGESFLVVGRVEVIDHPETVRGRIRFPGYVEIRVVGRMARGW